MELNATYYILNTWMNTHSNNLHPASCCKQNIFLIHRMMTGFDCSFTKTVFCDGNRPSSIKQSQVPVYGVWCARPIEYCRHWRWEDDFQKSFRQKYISDFFCNMWENLVRTTMVDHEDVRMEEFIDTWPFIRLHTCTSEQQSLGGAYPYTIIVDIT